jgi:hypothetical protein
MLRTAQLEYPHITGQVIGVEPARMWRKLAR